MHRFLRELITEWRRLSLPVRDETVIVAVSGGADSMSLLTAISQLAELKKLHLRLVAAHFDHRLRPQSEEDLAFVRSMTTRFGIELAHSEWKGPRTGNLEQAAREARYRFLVKVAEELKAGWILTAHTMNDRAETVLMNLIRGSGPEGMGGIPAIRDIGAAGAESVPQAEGTDQMVPFPDAGVVAARPMLRWAKRGDTEKFCVENGIEYCHDPMNEDLSFRRVWIRKVLIPTLEEANPKIVETLARTAELFRSSEVGPAAVSETAIQECPSISEIKQLDAAAARTFIREWLREVRGSLRGIGLAHIESVERLVRSERSARVVQLPGGAVQKTGGRLKWRENKVEK